MRLLAIANVLLLISSSLSAQRGPVATPRVRSVVQGSLIVPGSQPFHLEASITEGRQATPYATIQMNWISPTIYREVIRSADFNSVRMSSNGRFYENDSARYFPLILQTLTTAMVDPKPIIDAVQEGDRVLTKSNGFVDESGVSCFDAQRHMCFQDPAGLKETVAAAPGSDHLVHLANARISPREVAEGIRVGVELRRREAFFIQRCAASDGRKMPYLFSRADGAHHDISAGPP
jgi:hypothetical protein